MLPLSVLEKTKYSILYEIPEGKPNPAEECTLEEEKRARVFQAGTKGATCWYYTFNLLRKRIGKNPCEELLKERAIEAACSKRRKEITAYDAAFPITISELYSETVMLTLKRFDLETTKLLLNSPSASSYDCCSDGRGSMIPYMKEFIKEKKHDNLFEFLLYKRSSKIIEINMKFLNDCNHNIDEIIENQKFKDSAIQIQAGLLDALVIAFSANLYYLNLSLWQPSHEIDGFIEELKQKGPLMIFGDFGIGSYAEEPFKTEQQLCGKDIYAWRPGATRNKSFAAHSVLFIGAKKTKSLALAYFIDPNDPSDPDDKNNRKIYKISFTNLTSNISSLMGIRNPNAKSNYAYYGNFKI